MLVGVSQETLGDEMGIAPGDRGEIGRAGEGGREQSPDLRLIVEKLGGRREIGLLG